MRRIVFPETFTDESSPLYDFVTASLILFCRMVHGPLESLIYGRLARQLIQIIPILWNEGERSESLFLAETEHRPQSIAVISITAHKLCNMYMRILISPLDTCIFLPRFPVT